MVHGHVVMKTENADDLSVCVYLQRHMLASDVALSCRGDADIRLKFFLRLAETYYDTYCVN